MLHEVAHVISDSEPVQRALLGKLWRFSLQAMGVSWLEQCEGSAEIDFDILPYAALQGCSLWPLSPSCTSFIKSILHLGKPAGNL